MSFILKKQKKSIFFQCFSKLKNFLSINLEKSRKCNNLVKKILLKNTSQVHQAVIKWKFVTKMIRNHKDYITGQLKKFELLFKKHYLHYSKFFLLSIKDELLLKNNATVSIYLNINKLLQKS